jgi:hypothetical protein
MKMTTTIGPAVGSKGQVGFNEEPLWGVPTSPPVKFVEFTGESVVSAYTNLVSASLRSDRAVHKQRLGTETAGGDINFELAPSGYGTLFKHALGKKRTKRKDIAFVLVYFGTDADRVVNVTPDGIASTGTTAGDNFSITFTTPHTHQGLIDTIHGYSAKKWDCFVPWGDGTDAVTGGYFARGLTTKHLSSWTLGASDYTTTIKTAAGVGNLETLVNVAVGPTEDATHYLTFFPVNFKFGIYEHTIDAAPTLPPGLTFEIGRDVAAFNYYGSKINTLALTINPGEIITGTVGIMAKGASTVGDPVCGTNTGWKVPAFGVRYAGTQASAKIALDIDGTREMFFFEHGAGGTEVSTYEFSLERGYYDHTGYYWEVNTIGGLMEFLEFESQYFTVARKGGYDPAKASTLLDDINLVAILSTADIAVNIDTDILAKPVLRGNYIGTDSGTSKTIYVKVVTGGACDGTATFAGSLTGSAWGAHTHITAGIYYDILGNDEIDTGFDIMFPTNVTLTTDDSWTFQTFKDENASVAYETEETFTGFQGAITMDGSPQGIMSMTLNLNNNIFGDKFELGDRQRAAVVPQKRTVEGSMNVEFDNLDLYRKFINGTAGNLVMTLTSDDYINSSTTKYSLQVRCPNIKFSGTTPVVAGEAMIQTDFPFNSLYDDVNSVPDLRFILTNEQSYI